MSSELDCEIEPINDQIAFRFIEDTTQGRFNQKTGAGLLVVTGGDKQVEYARWGRVLAVGPEVELNGYDIGDIVLIENLRWTNEFIIEGVSHWLTRPTEILAVLDDPSDAPGEISNYLS